MLTERTLLSVVSLGAALLAGCVPADEAGGLGSVQFTFVATERTADGVPAEETNDAWSIRFDRTLLGFKTMTIGKIGVSDTCSYRGRGASSDVVFDPRKGLVQTFNGIQPVECPDVGIIFGSPDSQTTLGVGVESKDLTDLASGLPAHGIIEATATEGNRSTVEDPSFDPAHPRSLKIQLRFDSTQTSTRFGGCRSDTPGTVPPRGIRIVAGDRDSIVVRLAAESLFRDAITPNAPLRVDPFVRADKNGDGIVTMAELDRLSLIQLSDIGNYRLPTGSNSGSFGDYIRVLFRFAFSFRDDFGVCVGNEPGTEEGGQPAPSP